MNFENRASGEEMQTGRQLGKGKRAVDAEADGGRWHTIHTQEKVAHRVGLFKRETRDSICDVFEGSAMIALQQVSQEVGGGLLLFLVLGALLGHGGCVTSRAGLDSRWVGQSTRGSGVLGDAATVTYALSGRELVMNSPSTRRARRREEPKGRQYGHGKHTRRPGFRNGQP